MVCCVARRVLCGLLTVWAAPSRCPFDDTGDEVVVLDGCRASLRAPGVYGVQNSVALPCNVCGVC